MPYQYQSAKVGINKPLRLRKEEGVKRTIRGLRNDLHLTQEQMAKELDIPIANYQRYERLEVKIPADVVVKIADMVGIVDIREIKYN